MQVELPMIPPAGQEEPRGLRIVRGDACLKGLVDLVTGLGDTGADRSTDAMLLRTQLLHRGNGVFQHTAKRAFPPGMRGTDHPGFRVGEQYGRAVCGQDTYNKARPVSYHGIGVRAGIIGPRLFHDHAVRRMHLIDGDQAGAGRDRLHRAAAILCDVGRVVARTDPDVQPSHLALGDTAMPAQKAMPHVCQQIATEDLDGAGFDC